MPRSQLPFLRLRLALPLALFVAVGSTALVWWINVKVRRENRAVFATLARTNAQFVRSARLPRSERTARDLATVLGVRVFFRKTTIPWGLPGSEFIPQPGQDLSLLASNLSDLKEATPEPVLIAGVSSEAWKWDVFVERLDEETLMFFVRPAGVPGPVLVSGETLAVLGSFWTLSFALAWTLSHGLVRPATLLGRLATGLAHEIHNPLAAIRLHAQLVETSSPDAQESLATIQRETQRIEGLVNQWLFLARPTPPQIAPTSLAPLVAEVVRNHAAQAAHAGATVTVEVAESLRVRLDQRRFQQAVGNVLLNSLQAMPRGGTLHIAGHAGPPVRLVFADQGPGFTPEALSHAGDLFFSEKEGGMGIGLNVTSEIVKAHGGALRLANAPGGGALVSMELPPA